MNNISEEFAVLVFFIGFVLAILGFLAIVVAITLKGENVFLKRKLKKRDEKIGEQETEIIKHRRNSGIDSLTNLYNRRFLDENMDTILKASDRVGGKISVAYMDLDGFKSVNDCISHSAGDRVLQVVSRRIKETLRDSDLLIRLGGDEFLAILIGTTEKDFVEVEAKIKEAVSSCQEEANIPDDIGFGVTIGFTEIKEDQTLEEAIHESDIKMYSLKERRKR